MGKVIGIIVVLAIAAFFAVLTCKSKSSDLFKWIGIGTFIAFAFTWIIPYGYISSGVYSDYQMARLGFGDIPTLLYYTINFCATTILYLFAVAGFYGVISKTSAYQAIVKGLAKKIKGKEVLTSILVIIAFVVLTSISKSSLVMVMFVPFVASILLNAKFDKLTTMGLTFGSILVGILGATYGTDSLFYFNYYVGTDIATGLVSRVIICGLALILFVIYNSIRVKKIVKKNKNNDSDADLFLAEETTEKGKSKTKKWPTIVILSVLLALIVIGGIDWSTNFGIEIFNNFHTWLTGLKIGEDFTLFGYLLGESAVALGSFEISTFITILIIAAVAVAINSRMSFNDFANAYAEGFGKFVKPVVLYVASYSMFVICYKTPIVPWIIDKLTLDSFNPYMTVLSGIVSSIFHADLGYTGYVVGSIVSALTDESLNVAHTLYVSTYGLTQIFMPTSGLLLVGLAYFKLDYKKWFKYIWIFAAAMLIVLIIFATVATYWI